MKKGKRCLAALLLAVVCGGWTAVKAYQVPQPLDNFYVADYAGVISDEDAETIRSINASLEQRNGAQIVVATVDFLDGEAIDDVAYQMFNEWKIGSEENLGVLLLMAGKKIITACRESDWSRRCRPRRCSRFWMNSWNRILRLAITVPAR